MQRRSNGVGRWLRTAILIKSGFVIWDLQIIFVYVVFCLVLAQYRNENKIMKKENHRWVQKWTQCGWQRISARKTFPISSFDFQNRAPNLIFLIVPVLRWWEPASVDSGKSACQNVCALQTSHLFQTLKGHTRKILLGGKFLRERKTISFNFQERLQFCVARASHELKPPFYASLKMFSLLTSASEWPVFTFFPCTFFLLNRSYPFNFNHCDHQLLRYFHIVYKKIRIEYRRIAYL